MLLVIALDRVHGLEDVLHRLKGEEALPGWQDIAKSCVLGYHRSACSQVAGAAVAEPATTWAKILGLGDGELPTRPADVIAVGQNVLRESERIDGPPAVRRQQPNRLVISAS